MTSIHFHISNEVTLHARLSRPAISHKKPLLVFLHYWGGSSSTWYKLTSPGLPTSLISTHPTLACDLRGWGKSTGPSVDDGTAYLASTMAKDIATALQQLSSDNATKNLLDDGFIFVAHSMGAKVALATLPALPSNLLESLKGFVLVAPAPPTALSLPPQMKEQQKMAYSNEESVRWTVENVLANPAHLDDRDIEQIVRDSLAGNKSAKEAWPGYGMQEDISGGVKKVLTSVSKGKLRASILVGGLDVVEPREQVDRHVRLFLEENGVETSLQYVANGKHLLPLEYPEAVYKEIVSF
ncbi:putative alpha/beta fold family hydrolase [Aspergillus avenaceus]|uniref:Putative alpha/beta fold family hydrolase n=1 Tax=Aspergillus avenaceus TaxID=36643 RepID=A0A5N6U4J0_ASPAV|nr:putative alpha/beta fold family hydrolase [Aspergillus avenaceus]